MERKREGLARDIWVKEGRGGVCLSPFCTHTCQGGEEEGRGGGDGGVCVIRVREGDGCGWGVLC